VQKRIVRLFVTSCLFFLVLATLAACSQPAPAVENTPVLKPAEFEVGPITLEPPVLMVGDTVTVAATVKNIGDVTGMYTAVLSVDGLMVDKKEVALAPQQGSIVEFQASELNAGKHTINIGESKISIEALPKQSKIAFSRYSGDYNWHICIMDSDGTNIQDIANGAYVDLCPAWSPDGTKIAFQSTRAWHPRTSIYTMDTDGENIKCLTPEPKICRFPVWSPDGKKIAYSVMKAVSGGGGPGTIGGEEIGPDSIFIMNPDGSGNQFVANGCVASWFPDSQRIAFTSNRSGIWEIYSANIDGSEAKKHASLPRARVNYGLPMPSCEFPILAVSPDGSRIVFDYFDYVAGAVQDIYILDIDTGKINNLTGRLEGNKYSAAWSPDSTKIAFTLDTINSSGIYVIDTDGSNVTNIIENGLWPAWHK
jgi:Tol biopolymer transport system component